MYQFLFQFFLCLFQIFFFTRDLNCFFYVFQTDICCQIFRCPCRDSDCNRIITKTDQILSKCSFCRKNLFSGLDMISIMRQCFLLIFRNHNAHLSYLFGPPCRYQLLSIPFTFLKQKLCQCRDFSCSQVHSPSTGVVSFRTGQPVDLTKSHLVKYTLLHQCQTVFSHNLCDNS